MVFSLHCFIAPVSNWFDARARSVTWSMRLCWMGVGWRRVSRQRFSIAWVSLVGIDTEVLEALLRVTGVVGYKSCIHVIELAQFGDRRVKRWWLDLQWKAWLKRGIKTRSGCCRWMFQKKKERDGIYGCVTTSTDYIPYVGLRPLSI